MGNVKVVLNLWVTYKWGKFVVCLKNHYVFDEGLCFMELDVYLVYGMKQHALLAVVICCRRVEDW
jgi:hypothetical protein